MQEAGADALVMTEKDAVKWPELRGLVVYALRVEMQVEDEARFLAIGDAPPVWGAMKQRWQAFVRTLFRALLRGLRVVPWSVAGGWGAALGALGYHLSARYRRVADANLRHAYGDALSEGERQALIRRVFQSFGRALMEFLKAPSMSPAQIKQIVRADSYARVEAVLARGKGMILLAAHFGNWELLARRAALEGYEFAVVARQSHDPEFNKITDSIRANGGYVVLPRGGSPRAILQRLRGNGIVAILPDQKSEDVFVPFFGRLAGTVAGPAVLSLEDGRGHRADVLPAPARRHPTAWKSCRRLTRRRPETPTPTSTGSWPTSRGSSRTWCADTPTSGSGCTTAGASRPPPAWTRRPGGPSRRTRIMKPLPPLAQIERLLIVKTSSLGDVIHALPAVQALKEAAPGLTLGWVVRRRCAELLRGNPCIDDLYVMQDKPALERTGAPAPDAARGALSGGAGHAGAGPERPADPAFRRARARRLGPEPRDERPVPDPSRRSRQGVGGRHSA